MLPGLKRFTLSRDARTIFGEPANFLAAEFDWEDFRSLQQGFQSQAGQAVAMDLRGNMQRLCPGMHTVIYEVDEVTI
jgi:hypothetical protein